MPTDTPNYHRVMPNSLVAPLADRPVERLARCVFGLAVFGTGVAMQKHGNLGLPPWDVFHDGFSSIVGFSFGHTIVATSALVMLLWIPLRQMPGLGTLINAVEIGVVADLYLSNVPPATNPFARVALMLGGIVVTGIGSGIYIGAGLGPGPRDGLMTGLAAKGLRISVARTSVEVTIMVIGVLLGGSIGVGTLAFAVLIGPIVARTLPYFRMRPRESV
jgi:uncharacterized membrane protein YczE